MTILKNSISAVRFAAILAAATLPSRALAQQEDSGPPIPPTVSLTDRNHVNFASGLTEFPIKLLSIGSGNLGLSLTVDYKDPGPYSSLNSHNSLQGYDEQDHTPLVTTRYYFIGLKGDTVAAYGNTSSTDGGTVSYNADGSKTFTDRNGTVMQLVNDFATSVTYANGKTLTYQGNVGGDVPGAWSVLQNNGLLVKRSANGSYVIVNLAYEYCDPNPAVTCALSQSWPTASESSVTNSDGTHTMTVTDSGGGAYQLTTGASYDATAIRSYHDKGWAPVSSITYWRCSRVTINCYYRDSSGNQSNLYDRVQTATKNGITWTFNYMWNQGPYGYVYELTSPYSELFFGIAEQGAGWPSTFTDELGRLITFDGTVDARVQQVHYPEGNIDAYSYDSRGNLTDIKKFSKTDSSTPALTAHIDYDTTCTSQAKCNKPNYYVDANVNRTDYTYDNATGLILTEQLPAVAGSGGAATRPVKRYSYVQRAAWYKNSNGAFVKDAHQIWLLASEKTCRTGATNIAADSCALAGDEIVTTYDYGPDSGPNNLWLRGVAVTSGGVTHRTCYGYDRLGNRISETQPNANLTSCP